MSGIVGGIVGFALMCIAIFFVLRGSGQLGAKAEKSEVVRWFNATHAVLLWINGKSVFHYGGLAPTKKARRNERQMLLEWWEIEDKNSLNDTLRWLMSEGHRRGETQDIGAWDYSRAMSLLSSGVLAGYISREEALNRSLDIAKIIQKSYGSWDEFIASYIKGYEIWSNESGAQRLGVYERLKNSVGSIYGVPWELELKREW